MRMIRLQKFFLCLLAFLALPAFMQSTTVTSSAAVPTQPPQERKAQEALPMAHGGIWDKLLKTRVSADNQKGTFSAVFPDDVKKLNGTTLTVSGFMLPLEPTEKFKHFLLSRRTPTCPYCPPGEPNEVVDVFSDKPVAWSDALVSFEGRFELINDGEKGLFFKMTNAIKK